MVNRMTLSKSFEGLKVEKGNSISLRFLPIWNGVMIMPQGKPHQPKTRLNTEANAWALMPQDRQEILVFVTHLDRMNIDQMEW